MQATTRVPDLVPIRYGRMSASPFAFFRGAAAVMAADLAHEVHSHLDVQLCGDAHLVNFGGFATPERDMIFDVNDFDETLPGPFEWDLKRLAASIEVAARARGFDDALRKKLVALSAPRLPRVRPHVRRHAQPGTLVPAARRRDADRHLGVGGGRRRSSRSSNRRVEKAHSKDHLKAVIRLTEQVDGSASGSGPIRRC